MQRKTHTALAALMALGIAGGAAAQNADANPGAGTGTDSGVAGSATGGTAMTGTTGAANSDGSTGVNKQMGNSMSMAANGEVKSYGDLVSSMKTGDTMAADLSGFTADSDVTFTTLSSLNGEGAENGQALDNYLSENETGLTDLRTNLSSNTDVMAALESEGYTADNVIGVQSNGTGGYNFIVDDTM